MRTYVRPDVLAFCLFIGTASAALGQGTAFTYQGRLLDGGNPANGLYDLKLTLHDAVTGGSTVAGPITNSPVLVSNGLFTTSMDFGAGVFTGTKLFLQIGVRSNGVAVTFNPLSPRQELTPSPYAITAENLDGTLNASQLTGTLPGGVLSGTYGNVVSFNNAGDSFTGNGAGLTGLNASALTTGTIPDARLSPNVALLNRDQTFVANNIFTSGSNAPKFMVTSPSFYQHVDTNSFTGISLQYDGWFGEGALMSSYTNGEGYLSFYTKAAGSPLTKEMSLDFFGHLAIDLSDQNNGALNNNSFGGAGLSFGNNSGEGIASKRTPGGNQWGLDFYTAFNNRMSIANSGFVGIGRQTPVSGADLFAIKTPAGTNTYGGMYVDTATAGAWPFYGFALGGSYTAWTWINGSDHNKWNLYDGGYAMTYDPSLGAFGVGTYYPSQALDVWGEFGVVHGLGNEQAYMGGDGVGGDVQFGSLNPGIMNCAFYNAGANAYMHIYCSSITIEGGADLAEPFQISEKENEIPQGAVVVIDDENPGHLKLSDQPYDTRVAGVVSGANGIHPGIQMQQQGLLEGGKNVALTGRVYVQADASSGAIRPGDLLTTSSTRGYAMRVANHSQAQGAILGKAMTGLKQGKGMVLVLVTLQ